jgi:hypothetical protein
MPVPVAALSKVHVLDCSSAGIGCSNPTRGMDICVFLSCNVLFM